MLPQILKSLPLVLAAGLLATGCKTSPSMPSPSSPSQSPPPSPSSSGQQGQSSTSGQQGQEQQSSSQASSGSKSSQQTGEAGQASGQDQETSRQASTGADATQAGEKGTAQGTQSEDQVLSEAMEVFDETMRKSGESAAESGERQAGQPQSGADPQSAEPGRAGAGQQEQQAGSGAADPNRAGTDEGEKRGSGETRTAAYGSGNGTETGAAETGSGGGGSARTDAEKVGTLDRQLDKELAQFDGIILERRERAIESENEQGGGSSGQGRRQTAGTATGGRYPGDEGGDSAPLLTATAEDTGNVVTHGNRPDLAGDRREGDYKKGDAPENRDDRIPDDIPSGDDDDIVARQLREAAMEEDDPELREKLWDEYRKYKQSVQAKR